MMHNLVITRRLVKNEYQNFMCYNEIELHAQNIDTNLDSVVNMIGRAYVIQLRRKRIFTLTSYTNLHLVKLRFQTCHNLCGSQLLTEWNDTQYDPTANRPKCLTFFLCSNFSCGL